MSSRVSTRSRSTAILPVNFDLFTYGVLLPNLNTVIFEGFLGNLAQDGTGSATLNSGTLPAGCGGVTLDFAYCLGYPWELVSNPVGITLVD